MPLLSTIDSGFEFTGTSAIDMMAGILGGDPTQGLPCYREVQCFNRCQLFRVIVLIYVR